MYINNCEYVRERANVEFEGDGVFVGLQVALLLEQVEAEELVVAPARALLKIRREFAHDALLGPRSVLQLDAVLVRGGLASALHHLHSTHAAASNSVPVVCDHVS